MDLAQKIAKTCKFDPSETINYDNLDRRTNKVFSTLNDIVKDLLDMTDDNVSIAAARVLDKNWSLVWPWMVALARAMVDNPLPLSSEGFKAIREFTTLASAILSYLTHTSVTRFKEVRNELMLFIEATPGILAILIELWLRLGELDLGEDATSSLLNAIGLFLQTLTKDQEVTHRRLPLKVRDDLAQVLSTTRTKIPRTILTGIAQRLSLSNPDFSQLRFLAMLFNILLVSFPRYFRIREFAPAEVAIRWVSLILQKLTFRSSKSSVSQNQSSTAEALCSIECLHFFVTYITQNVYLAIPALDEGLLLHVFKLQNLVFRHLLPVLHKPFSSTCPVAHVELLFGSLADIAVHRPIMVRLVRWIRKIKTLGLDDWIKKLAEANHPVAKKWTLLVDETCKRGSISRNFMCDPGYLCRTLM
ncbi:hypothetical protein V5O48_014373 [Marasmius crinis-equi]|uniref:Uncharacterized protein n=1 Tax=Marasmius crinis-equi TaxID=585013 RepID=A0ABR3EXK1_9AGAR